MIYNYITTNLINGKQYVGSHQTDNLEDGYLGTGKYFLRAVKKYGKSNFRRSIICFCNTIKEAFLNEEYYIKKFNTLSPTGYNLSLTGGFQFGGKHSEESIQKGIKTKIKNGTLGGWNLSKDAKDKISKANKGRKLSEEVRNNMSKRNKGKKLSEESKRKISKSRKGCIPWNKGKTGIYSENTLKLISAGSKGRKASEETRMKMRGNKNAHGGKGKKKNFSLEGLERIRKARLGKHHSEETKKKISNSEKLTKSKNACV